MSKYHPKSKPSAYRPQAPSVTAAPCQLPPGGSYGVRTFPHGFVPMGSANCESLSQKSEIFASSLWQGSLFAFGIVTERKGERKQLHHALTAEARRPRPVSAACRRTYYIFPLPYSLKLPGIVTLQKVSYIPPDRREVAWGEAPRRREPAGA